MPSAGLYGNGGNDRQAQGYPWVGETNTWDAKSCDLKWQEPMCGIKRWLDLEKSDENNPKGQPVRT